MTASPQSNRLLRKIYGDIDKVDTVIGLLGETPPDGFGFSDTAFRIFVLMASRRLQSDRFLTVDFRPEIYSPFGMDWIANNGMTSLILRHCPELSSVMPRNARYARASLPIWDRLIQARCSQVLLPDASLREGLDEPIPGWQRQAKPERLRRVLRDAAQRQIRPRLTSDLGVEQVSPEPLRCRLIDLPNALSLRLVLGRLACGRNRDGHPRLPRQLPKRFAESEILSFHQECEDVSTHPAPKAMEHLSGWTDGKGRSLLRMEWTETLQVLARSGQGYVAGHHVGDVRPLLNLLNELLGNEALAH